MRAHGTLKGLLRATLICALLMALFLGRSSRAAEATTNVATVITVAGRVEFLVPGRAWEPATEGRRLWAGDRLQTGDRSRATLQMYDSRVVQIGENSMVEILQPAPGQEKAVMSLWRGLLYFFSRGRPFEGSIRTRTALAAIHGTEFVLSQDDQDRTVLTLLDGEVFLTASTGQFVKLTNRQRSMVEPGKAPTPPTAVIDAVNVIQWCLYYPAVLDLDELSLTPQLQQNLSESLAAYRNGDLLQALARYPENRSPESSSERIFLSALLLSVGEVERAESVLAPLTQGGGQDERLARLASALRTLVAAVKRQRLPSNAADQTIPSLASEWLAESYYLQSQTEIKDALKRALAAARKATEISPGFSFAWARIAELEFAFGGISSARSALKESFRLAQRNAQAIALDGFLFAAENHTRVAITKFNQAIAIDGALGNAWLGRGLCRIRRGDTRGGREDLLVAAALEPQRALLRSYLGKAFTDAGNDKRSTHELELARDLDPNDPTSWLYSSLLKQQQNQINDAIADLETSQERNNNRSLFRSRSLLDEDRAVGSANLASIYRDAGMTDVSVREAARAVSYDYANSSAHLFLSDSYNELRDPTQFNLRYQTVWFNELLLANLLSPVGGGRLSQNVSQQEYSKLFQADGLGLANSTLFRSDNKSVTEYASQFGTFGGTGYSLDLNYQHNEGVRVNNDLDNTEWYTTVKQQITPEDTALLLVKYEDYHSGDNFQYYYPTNASPNFRFDEFQQPILLGGWHHEWSPGVHTLLLGGRLVNEQHFSDQGVQLPVAESSNGQIDSAAYLPFDLNYHAQLEIYTAELNQIVQWNGFTLCAGGRYQRGTFDTQATLTNPPALVDFGLFTNAFGTTAASSEFERISGYGYLTVEPLERLRLTGGLAYEDMTFPRNFRHPPISSGNDHRSLLGPKASLVWEPRPQLTVRGLFAKSLGGVSLDESYRLEPTQLAGFPQAFRNLIPESVVGSVAAPEYQTYGGALDLKFASGTYAGVQYERLESNVRQTVGYFLLENGESPFVPRSTLENLDYSENSIVASLNQLLGHHFVIGVSYKFDQVELRDDVPNGPVTALSSGRQKSDADLHHASGYILFNDPSGFFARAETHWYHQGPSILATYGTSVPGDDFFQHNLFVGYRFARRHLEVVLGLLNLTGQDYHLNPLTVYTELPRERSFTARLNFQF